MALVDERVAHDHGHGEAHHHELGFWQKYVFSQDHKVIGIQYGFTALCFLLFGFTLMMMMRWSIAYPNQPVPVFGHLLSRLWPEVASKGIISAELYNQLGAMH